MSDAAYYRHVIEELRDAQDRVVFGDPAWIALHKAQLELVRVFNQAFAEEAFE